MFLYSNTEINEIILKQFLKNLGIEIVSLFNTNTLFSLLFINITVL